MKKISLLLLAVIISSVFSDFGVLAADTDFTVFYDFNDYTAQVSSGEVPTEEWSYFKDSKAFGSDGNGALQLNWSAKPSIHLAREVKCVNPEDSMHISFKAKVNGQLIVGTAKNNSNHNEDIKAVALGNRARHNMIKITPTGVSWDKAAGDGGCTAYSWQRASSDKDWHRYDLVRKTDGSWIYYVDGVNVMGDKTCKENAWGGFHGSAFSYLYFFENASSSTVDDVKIRVQKGSLSELSLSKTGDDRVERDKGVLNISLSEPVKASDIIKESFTIKNNVTGEAVTDFEVVADEFMGMTDVVTVKFGANTLTSGDYSVALDSSVKGIITETSAQAPLVFKPAYKHLNGVIYPEAELIEFLGIDGNPMVLSDNMSAGLKEIVVKFNTVIDDTDIKALVVLKDEKGVVDGLQYDVTNVDEKSVLTIGIKDLLKPYEAYTFTVSKGIPAKENTEVKSENDDEYTFKTAMPQDGGSVFGITRNEVVREENKYYFSVAKTDSTAVSLWALAAVYKTVKDEEQNEFDVLVEMKCFPIVLTSDNKGTFEYEQTFKTDLSNEDIEVKTYINEYPSLLPSGLK